MNVSSAAHIYAPNATSRIAVIVSGTGSTEATGTVTPDGSYFTLKNGANAILIAFSDASSDTTFVDTTNGIPVGPYEAFPWIPDATERRVHVEARDGASTFYCAIWKSSPQ
jgi:hypothetical protein